MKIGIIGSGNIGGTSGQHWAKAGHEVMFSSRNPEALKPMATAMDAQTGTVQEAATFGEVILLAIPFGKIPDLAQQIGRLDHKILIDATNPYPQRDGDVARQVIEDKSQTATGYVASQFPGAHTIKAFNRQSVALPNLLQSIPTDSRSLAVALSDHEKPHRQIFLAPGFAALNWH
jgi:predicted dinucleotide-binding enzyme